MMSEGGGATFWEHLEELRRTLIRAFLLIAAGWLIAFCCHDALFPLLTHPLVKMQPQTPLVREPLRHERIYNRGESDLVYTMAKDHEPTYYPETTRKVNEQTFLIPPNSSLDVAIPLKHQGLMILGPLEGFLVTLKVSFWVGLIATSPFWMMLLLNFIAPALKAKERRLVYPFLLLSLLFFLMGFAFAYFLTIPVANRYLYTFNSEIATNLWSFSGYIDYTLILLLSNGLAFQLAVIVLFLVQLRILSAETMAAKRRHMILGAFIIGALLTPPDILTQLMLAVPLIALYELILLYARLLNHKLLAPSESNRPTCR